MIAEALDLVEGPGHDVSLGIGVQLETAAAAAAQTQDLTGLGNGCAPKVRKPYTIKKQREKWSDEEHQRFLEALKTYGRGWRQIEEHVGTKTAIQIRSHAQKFFAKVARDSNDGEGSLDPIDIPPPRPKKKPIHPYPRKVADSPKTVDKQQPEQSTTPRSDDERNMSPTSVLSAIESDTCGSPFSGMQRSRLSSFNTDDGHTVNVRFTENENENENECKASDSTIEEARECLYSSPGAASTAPDDKSNMELDLLTSNRSCPVEDSAPEAPTMTIKLFGKTVEVKENQKLLSSAAETTGISPPDSMKGIGDISQRTLGSTDNVDSPATFPLVSGGITSLACLVPPYALSEASGRMGTPFWTWFNSPVLPTLSLCNQKAVETAVDSLYKGNAEYGDPQRAGSSTGSNSRSVTSASNHPNLNIDSKNLTRMGKQRSVKGFVPYKRCLAQRDATSSIVAAEEREGQRSRVCS